MKNKENIILITGGFMPSQLLCLLPIIFGYAKNKKITKLVIDTEIPSSVLNHTLLTKDINNFEIIYFDRKLNFFFKFFLLIKSFFLSIFLRRKILLNSYSWSFNQILHGIWDLSMLISNKDSLEPSYLDKFKSSYGGLKNLYTLKKNLSNENIFAFIGHTVYHDRLKLSFLRQRCECLFAHANFCYYKIPKEYDIAWNMPHTNLINSIFSNISNLESETYWKRRRKGYGDYEDSVIATKKRNKSEVSVYPKNVILLHIFKDSPFNLIDPKRIFADYVSWIETTIKIISYSNEKWSIRLHPNSKRWGEDQMELLKKILNNINNHETKNIIIDDQIISNVEVFKYAKRIVTFSGTPHVESACFGIKPIVIRSVLLSKYLKSAVLKVKSINHYKELLLKNSDSKEFIVTTQDQEIAKKFLFMQEKVIPFRNSVSGSNIYRNDSNQIIESEFNDVSNNLKNSRDYLFKLGKLLATGLSHTFDKNFIDYVNFKNF